MRPDFPIKTLGLCVLVALSSCGRMGITTPAGKPVTDVAANGDEKSLRILDSPSPLRTEREIPVLSSPEVLALYVPSHIDRERDLMVGEHWVFVKLRDAEWFVEKLEQVPKTEGEAREAELVPLKSLNFEKVLVPYRKKE